MIFKEDRASIGLFLMKNKGVSVNKKIAIHQSQYLPWPPYFKKVAMADLFVILDDVQFQKNGVQNRNKIRNSHHDYWLTVPVSGHLGDSIREKPISGSKWKMKHWKSIEASYKRSPFWVEYADALYDIYVADEYTSLFEINQRLFEFFLEVLEIETEILVSSDLHITEKKSDLVLSICKALGADIYLSGLGANSYLDLEKFTDANITIQYLPSISPNYEQFHGEFISGLSMLDMLFNVNRNDIKAYLSD